MAEILDSCRQPKNKTQVMYEAILTWSGSNYYLSVLQSCGLLNVHHSIAKYETTQKGLHFVEKWKELAELLRIKS
jgi:predicted transcriptional regulator